MPLLTISITDPGLDTKHAEIAFARYALGIATSELGKANGNATTGTIFGAGATPGGPASLGSWTYTPSATKP
jgi:hypothetical protein